MHIIENILTRNDCYVAGKKITVKGLMLHSIGTSQPDPMVFVRGWNAPNIKKCVHAFIGGNGDVQKTLPWNHLGWHGASGPKGSVNNTHIGVEMCEPSTIKYTGGSTYINLDPIATRAFVLSTYNTAVELFAMLAKQYNLNPLTNIISHAEGYKLGVASNHGDPEHLWRAHGLTMAQFRKDVQAKMAGIQIQIPTIPTASDYPTALIGQVGENVRILQNNLIKLGFNISGGADASYGPATTAAVKAFQISRTIENDGQAGPETQLAIKKAIEALNAATGNDLNVLQYGDKGPLVKVLQENLVLLGYLAANQVDESFGAITQAAVKGFQTKMGLEVDGIAGPFTQAKIDSEVVALKNTIEYYRVRKSWGDVKSQIGAFKDLNSAKSLVDQNEGYYVFNSAGVAIYKKEDKPVPTPEPIPTPEPVPTPKPTPEPVPEVIKHPIMGKSNVSPKQMASFVTSVYPESKISVSILELATMYLEEGAIEGVRGDIAFAQAIKETGYFQFKGDVLPEQNNYAGIGAIGGGAKGQYFTLPRLGIRAQIQHLKAYATDEPLELDCVDPRFDLVTRGIAPNWENLNGRWAVPGPNYGEDILALYEKITAMVVKPEPILVEPEPTPIPEPISDEQKIKEIREYAIIELNKIIDNIIDRWIN